MSTLKISQDRRIKLLSPWAAWMCLSKCVHRDLEQVPSFWPWPCRRHPSEPAHNEDFSPGHLSTWQMNRCTLGCLREAGCRGLRCSSSRHESTSLFSICSHAYLLSDCRLQTNYLCHDLVSVLPGRYLISFPMGKSTHLLCKYVFCSFKLLNDIL